VRRAQAFTSFAIAAAEKYDVSGLQLPGHFNATKEGPLSAEELTDLKAAFSSWVSNNALRELVEALSVCLDHCYYVMLIAFPAFKNLNEEEKRTSHKNFHFRGLQEKFSTLVKNGLTIAYSDDLESLNRMRNAMTHWRGIVRDRDCNIQDALRVSWQRLQIGIRYEDGSAEYLLPEKLPYRTKGEGRIFIQRKPEERTFPLGSLVKLNPSDIFDICMTFYFSIEDLKRAFVQLAIKEGINFKDKTAT